MISSFFLVDTFVHLCIYDLFFLSVKSKSLIIFKGLVASLYVCISVCVSLCNCIKCLYRSYSILKNFKKGSASFKMPGFDWTAGPSDWTVQHIDELLNSKGIASSYVNT